MWSMLSLQNSPGGLQRDRAEGWETELRTGNSWVQVPWLYHLVGSLVPKVPRVKKIQASYIYKAEKRPVIIYFIWNIVYIFNWLLNILKGYELHWRFLFIIIISIGIGFRHAYKYTCTLTPIQYVSKILLVLLLLRKINYTQVSYTNIYPS